MLSLWMNSILKTYLGLLEIACEACWNEVGILRGVQRIKMEEFVVVTP